MKELVIPRINNGTETLKTEQSVVFVGANGSGKTRLGVWIELVSSQRQHVHRVSAQKSLSLPDFVTPHSLEISEKDLLFGGPNLNAMQKGVRWKNKPATALIDDYKKLMTYLFSDETEENSKFKNSVKSAITELSHQ